MVKRRDDYAGMGIQPYLKSAKSPEIFSGSGPGPDRLPEFHGPMYTYLDMSDTPRVNVLQEANAVRLYVYGTERIVMVATSVSRIVKIREIHLFALAFYLPLPW
ncbi:hypothetical protein DdX_16836 [Ditylenchus destructor]|uniref:Uncharacterized protein n=1 Tax=Ditylenchus destructor TaxID=166010 RepID=A0AAD4MNV6_9BILA|nr:hypothetical protein DdX_16836 [Ditylenchus destructor]